MQKFLLLIYLVILGISVEAASRDSLMKISFEELGSLQQTEKRPLLVFIKTSWCSYCKAMEQAVFKHPEVIKKLNEHFYTIILDAESRREITFSGRLFSFRPTGENTGIHELAEELAAVDGRVSYPALCVLKADNEIIFQHQGFLDKTAMLKILMMLQKDGNP